MSDATVARRYAQALYEEAEAAGDAKRIDEDMKSVQESLDASRDLDLFFRSPIIASDKKEAVIGKIPLASFGETGDIASAVTFLASKEARYITGQVLAVDGGMTM